MQMPMQLPMQLPMQMPMQEGGPWPMVVVPAISHPQPNPAGAPGCIPECAGGEARRQSEDRGEDGGRGVGEQPVVVGIVGAPKWNAKETYRGRGGFTRAIVLHR